MYGPFRNQLTILGDLNSTLKVHKHLLEII